MDKTVEAIKTIEELKTNEELNEKTVIIEIVKTFSQKLEILLNSSFQEKYEIKLNPSIITLLLNILKLNSDYFNSSEELILKIIKDNKINIDDIPNILLLSKNLYEILYKLKNKDIKDSIIILKFIINVIMVDNITNKEDINKLTLLINNIIDTSSELISIRKILKSQKKSFLGC
jgi:hypothetical protein